MSTPVKAQGIFELKIESVRRLYPVSTVKQAALPAGKKVLSGEGSFEYLHPKFRERIVRLIAAARAAGWTGKVGQTVRSLAFQQELYAQGRNKPGSIVTYVDGVRKKAGHVLGCAIDVTGDFDKIGNMARSFNLEWGGNWAKAWDKPHIQLPRGEWP